MDDVLAVTVTVPLDPAGMVIPVLKAPVAVVLKEKAVEPTTTVPVVDGLNPVPDTVTADPAGPDAGLNTTCAAGAAFAGWIKAMATPAVTKRAMTNVLTDRNKVLVLHVDVRPQPLVIGMKCTGSSIGSKNPQTHQETHNSLRNHF
jgi:hypothetical protein